jgi:hypothetical protein
MPDKIVTLAMFYDAVEAQLAKNRLEAEGIPVFITGDTTGGLFGGMGGAFGTVHLQVTEENYPRASALLEADEDDSDEEDESSSTSIAERKTLEGKMAHEPPQDATDIQPTPSRKTFAATARESSITKVPGRLESTDEDDEDDDSEVRLSWGPDDYANRAWRAAVLGIFFAPITFYSVWMLIRLLGVDENLSPSVARKMYAAIACDAAVFLCWLGIFFSYR